jgi:hypothetical protein
VATVERPRSVRQRDPCVVPTPPLARLLCEFRDRWNRERPPYQAGRFRDDGGRSPAEFVNAVSWVAAEAGLPRYEVENVLKARTTATELRTADALLAAIGRPEALQDGTLPIVARSRRGGCGCASGSGL